MGLSSCIILLGIGIIYTYTGLIKFESIYSLISVSNNHIIQSLILGFLFIIIGFLFKIAAAPLHNWAPERELRKFFILGKTIKFQKHPKSYNTKLYSKGYKWMN